MNFETNKTVRPSYVHSLKNVELQLSSGGLFTKFYAIYNKQVKDLRLNNAVKKLKYVWPELN